LDIVLEAWKHEAKNIQQLTYIAIAAVFLTSILIFVNLLSVYGTDQGQGSKTRPAIWQTSLNSMIRQVLDAYKEHTISRITLIEADGTVDYDSTGEQKRCPIMSGSKGSQGSFRVWRRGRYQYIQHVKYTDLLLCSPVKGWRNSTSQS
jgi:hypothetical protein